MMTRQIHRGALLLVVVCTLTITVMTCAVVANRSLSEVATSNRLATQLQSRWARISLQRALLDRSDLCFAANDLVTIIGSDRSQLSGTVEIAGQVFDLRLSDEQAKLNPLRVCQWKGVAEANAATQTLGCQLAADFLPSYLGSTTSADQLWQYRNWAMATDAIDERNSSLASMMSMANSVTLWGDGRLNWRRADTATVRQFAITCEQPEPLAFQRNVSMEEGNTAQELDQTFYRDSSGCYSLWIVPKDSRLPPAFLVRIESNGGFETVEGFQW